MTAGPLHPDNLPAGRDRSLGKGHGTESLGPSDSSDSGSDLKGAPSDVEESFAGSTAGPDVGDANLDSDSDRGGTGERASSGRDTAGPDGIDIDTDRIESIPDLEQIADLDEEDEEGAARRRRH
jgi:hypothetical protein